MRFGPLDVRYDPGLRVVQVVTSLQRGGAERLTLDASKGDVREISATPQKLPARTDWTFIFTDTTVPPLPKGEPRIRVDVAGDEVAAVGRSMFVPEDWERQASAVGTQLAAVGFHPRHRS